MTRTNIATHIATRPNAPNVGSRLSVLVDVAQAAIDDARAAGLHGIADELDTLRAPIATLALRLWRAEGGTR
jgi:hypothetical protein